eukprot:TRINITY_DN11530_c0_g2_i5.p1 TRINITY_DN11530_c0_g2~~TRINITY_DN11530_c0_g2_i5.p1  ORF type:complete len:476 (-),score=117.24 TRINITY_DN11530_c0_g2_i5:224-1591(-)
MPYLKKVEVPNTADDPSTQQVVKSMLERVEKGGEQAVRDCCKELDKYEGDILLSPEAWEKQIARVPEQAKKDIQFAHARIKAFAEAQLASIKEFKTTLHAGHEAGQRVIPITTAGCYVPGGRYAHIASALMTVTTAKVAGVKNVVVATPTRPSGEADDAVLYAAKLCGADKVLCCGGVQGVAALRHGLFTGHPAEVLVGPGNKYVAEAKRMLFGDVGIDMIAGPTEIGIIADDTADSEMVATDIVSQAEHGLNSPCWLFTTSERIAKEVAEAVPRLAKLLPEEPRKVAEAAWRDFGEIFIAKDREECAKISDQYASEHLEVHVDPKEQDWWLENLKSYGSLFMGEETCVTYGDKCSGPNHVLPTRGVAKYSGGLSVHKFLKVLTWQRMDRAANRELGAVAARISRFEGMEGHARAGDARLAKYFPEERDALLKGANAPMVEHTDRLLPPAKRAKN